MLDVDGEDRRAPPERASPRLNPFAFPSDTDLRFVLLVLAVVGISFFMYDGLYFHVHGADYRAAVVQCQAVSKAASTDTTIQVQAFLACLAPSDRQTALWILGGAALVVAIAAAIYWTMPYWKIRREGLQRFTAEDDPELIATVDQLAREIGLRVPPIVLTNADVTPGGLAFGNLGRHYLVLNAGLILQNMLDPPFFRAVVLHEMAHLRNGDVDKTYFGIAAGAAFLVAGFAPFIVSLALAPGTLVDMFNELWRVVVALLLIYLPLAGILRARELYADVRASSVDGPDGALQRALENLEDAPGGRLEVLRLHPEPDERKSAVADPRRLLGIDFWEVLASGAAAMVAYPDATLVLRLFASGNETLLSLANLAAGTLLGALVAGIAAIGVWRAVFRDLTERAVDANTWRLALGMAIGLTVGLPLSLTEYLQNAEVDLFSPFSLAFDVLWGLVVAGSAWLFLNWVVVGARAWLSVAVDRPSPRPALRLGLIVESAIFGLWLAVLLQAHDFSVSFVANGSQALGSLPLLGLVYGVGAFLIVLPHPITLVVILCLWAFPLAAGFWPGPELGTASRWFWLDRSTEPLDPANRTRVDLGAILLRGVKGGAIFCALALIVHAALRVTVPRGSYDSDSFYTTMLGGQVVGALLFQIGIMRVATRRGGPLAVVNGIAGVWIAGLVMTAGIFLGYVVLGEAFNHSVVPLALGIVVGLGTVLGLAIAGRPPRRPASSAQAAV